MLAGESRDHHLHAQPPYPPHHDNTQDSGVQVSTDTNGLSVPPTKPYERILYRARSKWFLILDFATPKDVTNTQSIKSVKQNLNKPPQENNQVCWSGWEQATQSLGLFLGLHVKEGDDE